MKVFVTGGTGYIGVYLIKRLAEEGHTVHALVRSRTKASFLKNTNVHLFEGDILNYESITKAMEGCHQVYHLAACTSVWEPKSKIYFDINVQGTINVLKAAKTIGILKTVVTSTAGVFGPSISGIIDENKVREVDFFNEYESSKAICESHIKSYVLNHNMDIVIVNPTRIYGPFLHGESTSVTLMIEKYVNGKWKLIPGKGQQIGNYVYAEDVVEGHIKAMERGKKGENYLLANSNHNYIDFFDVVKEASGKHYKMLNTPMWLQMIYGRFQQFKASYFGIRPTITPKWINRGNYNWEASNKKSVQELGMNYTSLKDGVKKTCQWVLEKDLNSSETATLMPEDSSKELLK